MSTEKNQESLDKILSNIKTAIGNKSKNSPHTEDDSIIELTEIISNDSLINEKSAEEVSEYIKDISTKADADYDGQILSDEEIKEVFKEVLKPYLQSWLNNNLSKIVKEVVEKEVKHVFDKTKV